MIIEKMINVYGNELVNSKVHAEKDDKAHHAAEATRSHPANVGSVSVEAAASPLAAQGLHRGASAAASVDDELLKGRRSVKVTIGFLCPRIVGAVEIGHALLEG